MSELFASNRRNNITCRTKRNALQLELQVILKTRVASTEEPRPRPHSPTGAQRRPTACRTPRWKPDGQVVWVRVGTGPGPSRAGEMNLHGSRHSLAT